MTMNRADRYTLFYAAAITGLLTRAQAPFAKGDTEGLLNDAARIACNAMDNFDGWVALQEAESSPDPFAQEGMPAPA